MEVQKRKQENTSEKGESMNIKDFEFARNELAEAQNARCAEGKISLRKLIIACYMFKTNISCVHL